MLFHITQTHTPDTCPIDAGGPSILCDKDVEGIKIKGMYWAYSEHTAYYIVEADSFGAVNKFLLPGFKRCTCKVTPVGDEPAI